MNIYKELQEYLDYSVGKSKEKCELHHEMETFREIDFSKYDLNNSFFGEVVFESCDFSTVYLSGASLCGCTFSKCTFLDNRFAKGMADYAIFTQSRIKGLDAFRADFYETLFSNLTISDSKIVRCLMAKSQFQNVEIFNTDFRDTNFNDASFDQVLFSHCIFSTPDISTIKNEDGIKFDNISIEIDNKTLTNLDDKETKSLIKNMINSN